MLQAGPAVKVTIHLNEDTGAARGFLLDEVLTFLQDNDVEGATVLRAFAGYGAHKHLHTSGAGDVPGLHLPVVLYFIETREKVDSILPELLTLVTDGLVEAQPTEVLQHAASAERVLA